MRAVTFDRYGGPEVLTLEEIAEPVPHDEQVLVRVGAASLNPFDWHNYRGDPWLVRGSSGLTKPKGTQTLGADVAGEVFAVGSSVSEFAVGDRVFGSIGSGACADFAVTRPNRLAKSPLVSDELAAALPMAAITALQALRKAGLEPGQSVLVNGASGGVGHLAVQLARALGATRVDGVCSTRNVAMVESLGADAVIDYTRDDFTRLGTRYDVILDSVGSQPFRALRRVLTPTGAHVIVGSNGGSRLLGPAGYMLRSVVAGKFASQRVLPTLDTSVNTADLALIAGWADAAALKPVVARTYPLAQAREALAYLETGRVAGKVLVYFN